MKVMKNYIKSALLMMVMVLALGCSNDDIILGSVDISGYESINTLEVSVLNASTNATSEASVMETAEYTTKIHVNLSKIPNEGVFVKLAVDYSLVDAINEETGYSYLPYFDGTVTLSQTELIVAPDDRYSQEIDVVIDRMEDDMVDDVQYLVPITLSSSTDGVTYVDSETVYLIKLTKPSTYATTYKGEGAMKTTVYLDGNINPLNLLEWKLEDGSLFFDEVILFASNMAYDESLGRVTLSHNSSMQFDFDNAKDYIKPLQDHGIKVHMSLLDGRFCCLTELGAKVIAQDIANCVEAYGLDGVCFDDEYNPSYSTDNEFFNGSTKSTYYASRFIYECKRLMPDKEMIIFNWGTLYNLVEYNSVLPGEFIDQCHGNYGSTGTTQTGGTIAQVTGFSLELALGSGSTTEAKARTQKEAGYGYAMYFALDPTRTGTYQYSNQISRIQTTALGIFDRELIYPPYYYLPGDLTPYSTDDL